MSSCKPSPRFAEFTDEQLIDILFDVSLANTVAENYPAGEREELREKYMGQIAEIHKLEPIVLDSIINYVHFEGDRFVTISDSLESRLKKTLEEHK
jgi:hypothetical protein